MKFNFKPEEVKYVKFTYKDQSGKLGSFRASLNRIEASELRLSAKTEEILEISTPQEIVLEVICADGIYKGKTVLKKVIQEEPYVFFNLEIPQYVEHVQKREYFRITASYDCVYSPVFNYETKYYEVKTLDISANGVSLFLHTLPQEFDSANIVITINNRKVQAKVRFVRYEKYSEGYKLSLNYIKISEADRDYISQICIKKQLEEKRSQML
ncbi:MAG: hypothetical protein E7Z89_05555 [Cyanobacteria bacterium SIG28]|nr:hypothetical protein [Cyanobacteria bacterium SIG28]